MNEWLPGYGRRRDHLIVCTAEEEQELRSLRRSLKEELLKELQKASLASANKKAKLTAERKARLKSLADSAEEKQEIGRLIEDSIEANRPKTVRDESLDQMRIDRTPQCSQHCHHPCATAAVEAAEPNGTLKHIANVCMVVVWVCMMIVTTITRCAAVRRLARLLLGATARASLPPFQMVVEIH